MPETNPVIRLFFVKMKQAFLDMPEADKIDYMKKDRENLDTLGMKAITMINCVETNDEWDYIGVEQWPSMEAIENREKFENEELDIDKYSISKTYIGTPESFSDYGKE